MHFTGFWKKNKVFWNFVLSYLLMMIITLIVGSFAYYQAAKVVEADSRERNASMLEQSMEVIDRHLSQIDKLTMQIALNTELNRALQMTNPTAEMDNYRFRSLIESLAQYGINNDFILRLFIYMENSNYIITPESLYDPDLFYTRVLQYQNISLEEWKEKLLRGEYKGEYMPATPVLLADQPFSVVTYMRSIPIEYLKKPIGNIGVLIDENEFHKLLNRITSKNNGFVYIADTQGRILASSSSAGQKVEPIEIEPGKTSGSMQKKILGEDMVVTYTTSQYNNWVYVAAVPTRFVLSKVDYIKKTTFFIMLAALLIGFLIALYLSYRQAKPVKSIVKMVREFVDDETETDRNEYDYLRGNVSQIISSNVLLREKMNRQMPIIQQAFYERLFKGEMSDLSEVKAILSYLETDIEAEKYMVVIMHMYDRDVAVNRDIVQELDMAKIFLKETIIKYLGNKGLTYDIDEKKIALLIYFYSQDEELCIKNAEIITNGIHDELQVQHGIRVSFAGGSLCDSLLDVSRSFEEARQVMECADAQKAESKIVWYNDISREIKAYYYPVDTETKLMNCVKAGEQEELEKTLKAIYQENVVNRRLPQTMLKYLAFQLRGSLIRLIVSMEVDTDIKGLIENLNFSKPFDEVFEQMLDIYSKICSIFNEQKKCRTTQLKEQIIAYIHSSYMNSDLGLQSVASNVGLTEGYLSHFFKDQTGENFISYVENIRMQHACDLLKETDHSISEIAQKVGYNSDQAFRRAFKRVKGVSPNAYRG